MKNLFKNFDKTLMLSACFIIPIVFMLSVHTALKRQPKPGYCTSAKIVRVIDGDTIEVEVKKIAKIRLKNIDAPEIGTHDGVEAKRFVENRYLNKNVIVFIPLNENNEKNLLNFTSFERIVGEIWYNGKDIRQEMLDEGHAKVVRGGF